MTDSTYMITIPQDVIEIESENFFLKNFILLRFGYWEKAIGHSISRGFSSDYVLHYCAEGCGWLQTEVGFWDIKKGDCFFLEKGRAHAYAADENDPWSIYYVHFKGLGVESIYHDLKISDANPIIKLNERMSVDLLMDDLNAALTNGYSHVKLFYATSSFQKFMARLLDLVMLTPVNSKDIDLQKVLNFMTANLFSDISLAEISKHVNISKYYFSRRFREKIGYSPMEYFNRLKIQKACFLLETTTDKIQEISNLLSFSTPYYFSEAFKRIMGDSPKDYRIRHKIKDKNAGLYNNKPV